METDITQFCPAELEPAQPAIAHLPSLLSCSMATHNFSKKLIEKKSADYKKPEKLISRQRVKQSDLMVQLSVNTVTVYIRLSAIHEKGCAGDQLNPAILYV